MKSWPKFAVGSLFVLSICVFNASFCLGFAGAWVAKYKYILEPLGVGSFLGIGVSGLLGIYVFRDVLFRKSSAK